MTTPFPRQPLVNPAQSYRKDGTTVQSDKAFLHNLWCKLAKTEHYARRGR